MRAYLGLLAALGLFSVAAILIYTVMQPDVLAFVEVDGAFTIAVADIRNACFLMIGFDLMGAFVLMCVSVISIRNDARLRKCIRENDALQDAAKPVAISTPGHIRAAFTLIELLVVIAIIGVLAALLMGGVMMMLRKGPEVSNRNDIMQLGIALDKFKTKHGFYPPSKIKLCKTFNPLVGDYDVSKPLDAQSVMYLAAMWPNLDRTQTFNWAGPTVIPNGGVILEGHQCLVFFLGGITDGKGVTGFYVNPRNPTIPTATQDKVKEFDFEVSRLVFPTGSPFPAYLDSHAPSHGKKTPFAYFSSYKRANGYASSDCTSLGVAPYAEQLTPTVKYINPSSYQLISAGADGSFGPGGLWTPSSISPAGRDDIANFSDRNLGVGQ